MRAGQNAEARAVWRTVDSLFPLPGGSDLLRSWLAMREGDYVAADSLLRGLEAYASPAGRREVSWFRAISLRNQGRVREALAADTETIARAIAVFESGRAREAAAMFTALADLARQGTPIWWARHRAWNFTHTATCLAAAGDTARLSALADSVERLGARSVFGRDPRLHHYVRGLLWAARGDDTRAAEEYRASVWSWSDGYTRANYELARAELALGRPREAIYPLQAALRGDLQASNLYVTRTELHELLARAFAALGEADSARTHAWHVVRAWRLADPPFAARRAAAARLQAGR